MVSPPPLQGFECSSNLPSFWLLDLVIGLARAVCVCECVCLCTDACAHVCMCEWRPEVTVRCLPQRLSILFTEVWSLTELGVHRFGKINWPVNCRDPPDPASPPPSVLGLQVGTATPRFFSWS